MSEARRAGGNEAIAPSAHRASNPCVRVYRSPASRLGRGYRPFWPFGPQQSNVEIQVELVWMRAEADGIDFLAALVVDPGADDVASEDLALHQELVVALQVVDRLLQAARRLRHLGQLLRLHVVDVAVERLAGLD